MNCTICLGLIRPAVRRPLGRLAVVSLQQPVQRRATSSDAATTGPTASETKAKAGGRAPHYFRSLHGASPDEWIAAPYPRYSPPKPPLEYISIAVLRLNLEKAGGYKKLEHRKFQLRGRVTAVRRHGAKLVFVDLADNQHCAQITLSLANMDSSVDEQEFVQFLKAVRRGDHISVVGKPVDPRKPGHVPVVHALELPRVYSRATVPLPTSLQDEEVRFQSRHIDLLANRNVAETLGLRSAILKAIRRSLDDMKFTEVQTPLLAANAGGAIARPFVTTATELPGKELSLRIAPELWLKRLVVGGLDRVYEIGPVFRNEGVDATHNPEFTTCEFYSAFWTLENLMSTTENLLQSLVVACHRWMEQQHASSLAALDMKKYKGPYQRFEFIPTLESELNLELPDLSAPTAAEDLAKLLRGARVSLGDEPIGSLPLTKMLDRLAELHIEPKLKASARPAFVTHHPECISPLAKSFQCPETGQRVAARAELYIDGVEMANMYEEENSPAAQRTKLERQAALRAAHPSHADDGATTVDEAYLAVLGAGLPPTGGWGCGVDRLVMHFAGAARISDVLSFGNLRHVATLASQAGSEAPFFEVDGKKA